MSPDQQESWHYVLQWLTESISPRHDGAPSSYFNNDAEQLPRYLRLRSQSWVIRSELSGRFVTTDLDACVSWFLSENLITQREADYVLAFRTGQLAGIINPEDPLQLIKAREHDNE